MNERSHRSGEAGGRERHWEAEAYGDAASSGSKTEGARGDGASSRDRTAGPPRLLIVAGSDSGGGAGIQADLKTCQELGVFGMTAITAVTAQNSVGVQAIHPVPLEMIEAQLNSVLKDIGSPAIKTGMLLSPEAVRLVSETIARYAIDHVVVDPVLHAKDGSALLRAEAMSSMRTLLFPLAEVITPNIPEACELLGWPESAVANVDDMVRAAAELLKLGPRYVLLKGGHLSDQADKGETHDFSSAIDREYIDYNIGVGAHNDSGVNPETNGFAVDVLLGGSSAGALLLRSPRLLTSNTHGTGCTTASAIAACLSIGMSVPEAVIEAKRFVTDAIACSVPLGRGVGALWHAAYRKDAGIRPAAE